MIELAQRTEVVTWIDECCGSGARLSQACEVLGLTARTLQRWRQGDQVRADARAQAGAQRVPANRLSEHERQLILEVANRAELAECPPSQIVPALADQGLYIASKWPRKTAGCAALSCPLLRWRWGGASQTSRAESGR